MDLDECYRLATEHSNEGVIIISGDRVLFFNQRCLELAGYHTAQEIDKKTFLSIVHPDDREKIKKIIKKRQTGKSAPSLYEVRVLRPDGSIIYVEISSCSITYRGQPASLGYLRDISDRKQIEEKLRRSEEKHRNILENIQDGYFEVDLSGTLTFVNDALCRIVGVPREQLFGMNNRAYTNEEEAKRLYQLFSGIYRTGEPVKGFAFEYKKRDGTIAFVEMSVSLIKDAEGKPIGFRGISRDVTERKQAEEIILRSEKRFKALYQESPIPTFTWQKKEDGFFLIDCNRAAIALTEGKVSNYMGRNALELYRKRPEILDYIIRCFKEQSVIRIELVSQRFAPGRLLSIYYSYVPPDLVIVHMEDITERKQAEEELYRSQQMLQLVLDNIPQRVFWKDRNYVYRGGNKPFLQDAGLTSMEEIIGKDDFQLSWKKTAPLYRADDKKVMENNLTQVGYEEPQDKPDGSQMWLRTSKTPLHDSADHVIGILGTYEDITEQKRAAEIMRESEERFRLAFENANTGMCLVDLKGNLARVNNKMCKIFGYTKEELEHMTVNDIAHPDDIDKSPEFIQKSLQGEIGSDIFEKRYFHKKGYVVTCEVSSSLVRKADGSPLYFISHIHDITERKRTEEALRESEEKYRTILESIEEGYYEVDLAGNMTFVNDSTCQIYGYPREELIGMNNRCYTSKETAKKVFQVFNEVYRTGKSNKGNDYEIIRKDGTKRHITSSVTLMKDSSDKTIGFRGITQDITERKKTEEILRQSEEKYRQILENMEEGYFEVDLAGNYTFVNNAECRNLGYTKEELIGMNNRQYQDEATVKKMYLLFNTLYKTGEPIKVLDVEIIQKDGTKKFNEISVSLIRDSKGEKIGFSGVSRDITERKRAEDALKKSREELIKKNQELEESRKNIQITLERLGAAYEELKTTQAKILQQEKMASIGQLAAGVAHEINNPMAFIASNLGTLDKYIRRLKDFIQAQSEAIKSLKATEVIKQLEKKRKELKFDYTINDIDLLVKESIDGSERVQKIVRELNLFSRVTDEEYKDANINECMESSINIVGNELKHKATLHKDYGNLPSTKCYPQKLNQVFINLLINAIQAIEEKGKIKIKTWEKDGSIWVTVSDTGCGIPRENQSKIFEPFFTTKEAGKGTGLGLSISYEIMQRHKGEISFESKEGKGTTFTIRIPVV